MISREEDTVRTSALVIPFPVAHVLARALDNEGSEVVAFRQMLTDLSHNVNALRETRIRAAQQMTALEAAFAAIAEYLPTKS